MLSKIIVLLTFLAVSPLGAVTFKDNDVTVLLGNTIIERAQKYGYIETALTLASDKKNLKFRNLGWSGDTVFGHARSYFGPPKEGFQRLQKDLTQIKPNIVIICYGAVAAFDGKNGLKNFINGYEKLINMISKSANPRQIILISPPPAQNLGNPLPDMTKHNKQLAIYSDAIKKLANKKNLIFGDLFNSIATNRKKLTNNGIHFTKSGYHTIATIFVKAIGLTPPATELLYSTNTIELRFKIIEKNKLFFHRWRPANETYLRLFRKHEQGNNAKELTMFDPLITNKEKEIETLKTSILNSK